jgi:hypothetical protein
MDESKRTNSIVSEEFREGSELILHFCSDNGARCRAKPRVSGIEGQFRGRSHLNEYSLHLLTFSSWLRPLILRDPVRAKILSGRTTSDNGSFSLFLLE